MSLVYKDLCAKEVNLITTNNNNKINLYSAKSSLKTIQGALHDNMITLLVLNQDSRPSMSLNVSAASNPVNRWVDMPGE